MKDQDVTKEQESLDELFSSSDFDFFDDDLNNLEELDNEFTLEGMEDLEGFDVDNDFSELEEDLSLSENINNDIKRSDVVLAREMGHAKEKKIGREIEREIQEKKEKEIDDDILNLLNTSQIEENGKKEEVIESNMEVNTLEDETKELDLSELGLDIDADMEINTLDYGPEGLEVNTLEDETKELDLSELGLDIDADVEINTLDYGSEGLEVNTLEDETKALDLSELGLDVPSEIDSFDEEETKQSDLEFFDSDSEFTIDHENDSKQDLKENPVINEEIPISQEDLDVFSLDEMNFEEENQLDIQNENEMEKGVLASEENKIEQEEDLFALDDMFPVGEEDSQTSLEDMLSMDEESVQDTMQETTQEEKDEKPSPVKENTLEENTEDLLDLIPDEKQEKKEKKKGILAKLFGNINDEKAKKARQKEEETELEKEKKKEEKKLEKEKAFGVDENGNPLTKEDIKKAKQEAKEQAQKEKKELKELKKKEKLEKKQKEKEEQAEIEEDPGRINRVGATIVISFFALLAVFVITGSNIFSYNQSIKKANDLFQIRKYTKAYDEVRGLTVKKKDQEIYDKIITVMYVNKQLNSYHNYFAIKMYPEALDSLLKGIERYDKYIVAARELGIVSDLDYVRDQILTELNDSFSLSEKDAYKIIQASSQEEYSKMVIKIAKIY